MSISIYNTLTSQKEQFKSILPKQVSMYCCGVTVYDLCHLGHARSYVVWDSVRRYLEWQGYNVQYIQNFTDIDDKILNRAKAEDSSMLAISTKYIDAYFADLERLNVRAASNYPRATDHIPQIIELIEVLEKKGLAYAKNGDVYYRVRQFAGYGKLSGRKLSDMQAGASGRVAEDGDSIKEDPFDFALWKAAKDGEPAWDSPWGAGRPGWHIECSAMIRSTLGQTIDIHCGGSDLVFPHHENEIAQSEGAQGQPLARYWMHNGMVKVDGEKMSKSLGNFTTIRDLLDRPVDPMVIRLFILTAQYRKPMDFTPEALTSNENSWQTLKEGLLFGEKFGAKLGWDLSVPPTVLPPVTPAVAPVVEETPSTAATPPTFNPPPEMTPLVQPFQDLPKNLEKFSREYSGLVILATILFFTQFPVRFLARFFDTFNTLPLLPEFFKLLGIAIVTRTILFKKPREQFFASVRYVLGYLFQKKVTALATTPQQTQQDQSPTPTNPYFDQFTAIVDEDFNFAGGLAILFELAKELGKASNILTHGGQITTDTHTLHQQWYSLRTLADVLGLAAQLADEPSNPEGLSDDEVEELLAEREAARANKNFRESDRIRNDLQAQGVVVVDRKGEPATWYRS